METYYYGHQTILTARRSRYSRMTNQRVLFQRRWRLQMFASDHILDSELVTMPTCCRAEWNHASSPIYRYLYRTIMLCLETWLPTWCLAAVAAWITRSPALRAALPGRQHYITAVLNHIAGRLPLRLKTRGSQSNINTRRKTNCRDKPEHNRNV